MQESLPILKGTLDILVLKALSWGSKLGFEITIWLETQSSGSLGIDDSAFYQVLHRMSARGLIRAEWGTTDNNRRARYYQLTDTGHEHLSAETSRWVRYASTVPPSSQAQSRWQLMRDRYSWT